MWQKIFKSNELKTEEAISNLNLLEPKKWAVPNFKPQDIRVLVCQDPGDQNKTALFDSDQLTQVSNNMESNKANIDAAQLEISSNTFPTTQKSPLRNPRRYNLGPIGDMMFGTVPMSFKGTTTKLHTINGPTPQLLLTLLFSLTTSEIEAILSKSIRSIPINNNFDNNINSSIADLVDPLSYESKNSDIAYSDHSEDSHIHEVLSTSVASSLSSFHNIHLDRRLKKAGRTSLENGAFSPTTLPSTKHDDFGNINRRARHTMFSIGIVIHIGNNRHLRDFLHSHYSLIEVKIHRLYTLAKEAISREFAAKSKSSIGTVSGSNSIFNSKYSSSSLPATVFLDAFQLQSNQTLLDQVSVFRQELISLYTTPRIQEPLWLNMLSLPNNRATYTDSFVRELTYLILNYDTKKTNYFISGLISNVLSHHLSWVPVVPANSYKAEGINTKLSYNPLWAQLSDLYGNVGCVSQTSRTIIVGSDSDLVSRVLFILTYFIRCNEIVLNSEKWSIEDFKNSESVGIKNPSIFSEKKSPTLNPPAKGLELTSLSNPQESLQNNEKEVDNQSLSQMIKDTEPRSNQTSEIRSSSPTVGPLTNGSDFIEFSLPQGQMVEIFPPNLNNKHTQQTKNEEIKNIPDAQFLYTKSYGRSLMSSYCNHYKPDFVLLGVPRFDFIDSLENDLRTSVQFSYDDPVKKAVCIVADTNTWQTHLIEYDNFRTNDNPAFGQAPGRSVSILRSIPSDHVLETLQETHQLSQFGMSSESCVQYLEDRLRQLYYKSVLLSSVLRENQDASTWDNATLASFIGVQSSDINIILSIASTYDPLTKSILTNLTH